jgi:hypothetical protein
MTMPVSEKNFLEKIASHIPGIGGYREREIAARDRPPHREFLAVAPRRGAGRSDALRNAATDAGRSKRSTRSAASTARSRNRSRRCAMRTTASAACSIS